MSSTRKPAPVFIPLCDLPREQPIDLGTLARSMKWEGRAGRLRLRRDLIRLQKKTQVQFLIQNGTYKQVSSLNTLEKVWPDFGRRAVQTDELRDRVVDLEETVADEARLRTQLDLDLRRARARNRVLEERLVKVEGALALAMRTFQETSRQWMMRDDPESGVHPALRRAGRGA